MTKEERNLGQTFSQEKSKVRTSIAVASKIAITLVVLPLNTSSKCI